MVAVLNLIPVVGATTAGIVISLVALTVSPIVCAATIAFFILYQFAEDYLLTPKIIGKRLEVPGVITVVAVLLGGGLLGVVGALVAIPAAALLLAEAMLVPRLERS